MILSSPICHIFQQCSACLIKLFFFKPKIVVSFLLVNDCFRQEHLRKITAIQKYRKVHRKQSVKDFLVPERDKRQMFFYLLLDPFLCLWHLEMGLPSWSYLSKIDVLRKTELEAMFLLSTALALPGVAQLPDLFVFAFSLICSPQIITFKVYFYTIKVYKTNAVTIIGKFLRI